MTEGCRIKELKVCWVALPLAVTYQTLLECTPPYNFANYNFGGFADVHAGCENACATSLSTLPASTSRLNLVEPLASDLGLASDA